MSKRKLTRLARSIFDITRREVWLGGKVQFGGPDGGRWCGPSWPTNIINLNWPCGLTWSLSPEVELGGNKLRLCISWLQEGAPTPTVRIFVNGEVRHPGGMFIANLFWGDGWIRRIAKEQQQAATSGYVDTRDLIITEAKNKAKNTPTNIQHKQPVYCDLCRNALQELDQQFPMDTPNKV